MTITLSRRRLATFVALIGLLIGGLYVTSGGQKTAAAAAGAPYGVVRCDGAVSGEIPAAGTKVGKVAGLELTNTSHGVTEATDPASGLPTGKRQHRPYAFTVSVHSAPYADAAVLLINSMVTNEIMKTCTFHYYAPDPAGVEKVYLTVLLTNAHLSSYSFSGTGTEQFQLVYQKITWTSGGSVTAADDWEAPEA